MVLPFSFQMKDLKMRFYKKTIYEDKDFGKLFPSVNKLSEILQVSQPYLHKVMTNQVIVSEKQYFNFQKKVEKYLKNQTQIAEKQAEKQAKQ